MEQMFAICLCVVVGLALGDLKRVEMGKDDMKAGENVREDVSFKAKETIKQRQYLRSKDVHTPAQCVAGRSSETETSEKLSSVVTPLSVTDGASKETKSEHGLYLGTRVMSYRSLLKHSHRNVFAKKASMDVTGRIQRSTNTRRLHRRKRNEEREDPFAPLRKMLAIREKVTEELASQMYLTDQVEKKLIVSYIKTGSASPDLLASYYAAKKAEREFLKEKLAAPGTNAADMINGYTTLRNATGYQYFNTREKFKAFFETPSAALTDYENFKRGEYASLDSFLQELSQGSTQENIKETKTEEAQVQVNQEAEKPVAQVNLEAEKPIVQAAAAVQITPEYASRITTASYSAMNYFLKKLPNVLKNQILITDEAERVVLENYVISKSAPTEALDAYNLAKKDERDLLKRLLTEVPIILPTYRALRKGVAWNYTKLHDKFLAFFQQPSEALAQFEGLKRDELASLDSFLAESSPAEAQEDVKNIETEEAATKRKIREAEIVRAVDIQDQLTVFLHN